MNRISPACRKLVTSLAIALPVFAVSLVVTPAPNGSIGVSMAEAKGKGGKSSAKGERGTKQKLAKNERSGGKGKAKTERERSRGDETQDSRRERHARRDYHERDYDDDHRRDRHRNQQQDHEAASSTEGYTHGEDRNWGATASQLKHRNAARASESAFQNASPTSNVGRISTYRDAARATLDKERDLDLLDRDIVELRRDRNLAIADGHFDHADAIEAEILRLEDERYLAEDDLYDLRRFEQDAYDSVGGPELNEHDFRIFRAMLGLE